MTFLVLPCWQQLDKRCGVYPHYKYKKYLTPKIPNPTKKKETPIIPTAKGLVYYFIL